MTKRSTNILLYSTALAVCMAAMMLLVAIASGLAPERAFAADGLAAAKLATQDKSQTVEPNMATQDGSPAITSNRLIDGYDFLVLGTTDAENKVTTTLQATGLGSGAANWSSSNSDAVLVVPSENDSMQATLEPVGQGFSYVNVTAGSQTATVAVYVFDPNVSEDYEINEGVRILKESFEEGDSRKLKVAQQDFRPNLLEGDLPADFYWQWSYGPGEDESKTLFDLTGDGTVTAKENGSGLVSLSLCCPRNGSVYNTGISATYLVTVYKPVVLDLSTLDPKNESQIRIDGLKKEPDYSGVAIEPLSQTGVNLLINGAVVDVGSTGELSVSYSGDHTSANQDVSITISAKPGARHFSNSVTIPAAFHINPLTLESNRLLAVDEIASSYYTGKAIEPKPNVTLDGKQLVLGADYTLQYASNVNAGKGSLVVEGKGNYTGTSNPTTFEIRQVPLGNATILLNRKETLEDQYYTGQQIRPSVAVVHEGNEIPLSGNYSVTYDNNITGIVATVTVKALPESSNVFGENSKTFKIVKQSSSDADNTGTNTNKDNSSSGGNSSSSGSSSSGTNSAGNSGSGSSGTAANNSSSGASGSGSSSASGSGSSSTNSGSSSSGSASSSSSSSSSSTATSGSTSTSSATKLTIASAKTDIDEVTVTKIASQVYTGKQIKPLPWVYLNGKVLWNGEDYKLTYKNNKKVGTATITITGIGKYKGTTTTKFKIVKAKNTLVAKAKSKVLTVKYSKLKAKSQTIKKIKAFKITKAKGKVAFKKLKGNKKISVNKKTGKVTVKKGLKKGTYKVKVKVRAAGTSNYKAKTKTVTLKIRVK